MELTAKYNQSPWSRKCRSQWPNSDIIV